MRLGVTAAALHGRKLSFSRGEGNDFESHDSTWRLGGLELLFGGPFRGPEVLLAGETGVDGQGLGGPWVASCSGDVDDV